MPEDYLTALMKKVKASKELQEKPEESKAVVQPTKIFEEFKKIEKPEKITEKKKVSADIFTELQRLKEEKKEEPRKEEQAKTIEKITETKKEEIETEADREIKEATEKIEIEAYGETTIYKIPGKPMLYYFVPTPRPTTAERTIINTIKEATTRIITISPYRIRDLEQRRNVYKQKVMEILMESPELKIPKNRFEFYANAVVKEMVGYGLIDPLVSDENLEEIMVIGPKKPVYVFHRQYDMMKTNIEFFNDEEIIDLVNRIAREVGRRIDISAPLLDARLPDGSRVNATIPPASISGVTLTIRKFRKTPYSIIDLIKLNTLTSELAAFLWLAVEGMNGKPANILIAGGTGSGKTTLLNVLASFIPQTERIITIEDTAELNLPFEHWIRFEARPPGLEEKGELTLDILTKNSLRMRPDRIIVGEVRHAEAFTLFTALNTGHDGCMGTIHANSAQETIVRVTNPPMNVPEAMLSGLDFIIVEQRIHDRKKGTVRRITEVSEVIGVLEGKTQTQKIFERDPVNDTIERTQVPSQYLRKLSEMTGLTVKQLNEEIIRRKALLEKLVEKNISRSDEVSKELNRFLLMVKSE